eukprot:9114694-Alexandrium_andersonii.AAC.1
MRRLISGRHFPGLRRAPPSGHPDSRKPAAIRPRRVGLRSCRQSRAWAPLAAQYVVVRRSTS